MQKLMSGFAAAAMVLALPLAANAQEAATPEAGMQDACTATIAPIHASENVAATATFSAPFGEIVSIEAPAESGLSLVTVDKTEMAVEGNVEAEGVEGDIEAKADIEERAPLAGETENVSTFWLNASETPAGTYSLTLTNESGESCTADITVEEKIEAESDMDEVEAEVEEELEEELEDLDSGTPNS